MRMSKWGHKQRPLPLPLHLLPHQPRRWLLLSLPLSPRRLQWAMLTHLQPLRYNR